MIAFFFKCFLCLESPVNLNSKDAFFFPLMEAYQEHLNTCIDLIAELGSWFIYLYLHFH